MWILITAQVFSKSFSCICLILWTLWGARYDALWWQKIAQQSVCGGFSGEKQQILTLQHQRPAKIVLDEGHWQLIIRCILTVFFFPLFCFLQLVFHYTELLLLLVRIHFKKCSFALPLFSRHSWNSTWNSGSALLVTTMEKRREM